MIRSSVKKRFDDFSARDVTLDEHEGTEIQRHKDTKKFVLSFSVSLCLFACKKIAYCLLSVADAFATFERDRSVRNCSICVLSVVLDCCRSWTCLRSSTVSCDESETFFCTSARSVCAFSSCV